MTSKIKITNSKISKNEEENEEDIIEDEDENEENDGDTDPNKDVTTYDLDINTDEIDWTEKWRFNILHKENMNGRDTIWYMGWNPSENEWFSGDGIYGMKIKIFTDTIIPKANRTVYQQALQEIKQSYTVKIRKGYIIPGEKESELINTMQGPVIDLDKVKLNYPVGVEPKLNGERCLAVINKNQVIMYSRAKVEWKDERKSFFVKDIKLLLSFLPRGVTLDGEMFGGDLSRQQINSMIKDPAKYKNETEINKISFNIFTYADTKTPAETRHANLEIAYQKYLAAGGSKYRIKIVPMVKVNNLDQLIAQHQKNKAVKYEGSVIYKFANGNTGKASDTSKGNIISKANNIAQYEESLYESGKRSGNKAHVYKLKTDINDDKQEEYIEEEGLIIDFYSAKGTQKDAIMFTIIDPRDNIFNCGLKGSIAERQKLYKAAVADSNAVVGKYLEYRYAELSDTGVPQQSVGLNIRDTDDVDSKINLHFKYYQDRLDEGEEITATTIENKKQTVSVKNTITSPTSKPVKNTTKTTTITSPTPKSTSPTPKSTTTTTKTTTITSPIPKPKTTLSKSTTITSPKTTTTSTNNYGINLDLLTMDRGKSYTLVELKNFAREMKISKTSSMSKEALINLIKQQLDESDDEN